jgi:membrane-bound lytic murein transglycosylase MltF
MNQGILNEAEKYRDIIYDAAKDSGIFHPSLIAGVIYRESWFGLLLKPKGPAGTGDNGHGHGLMQIDDRYFEFARTGKWQDPKENILFGTNLLKGLYEALKSNPVVKDELILPGALAAYNSGLSHVLNAIGKNIDVDSFTSGRNYSKFVLQYANDFVLNGWD